MAQGQIFIEPLAAILKLITHNTDMNQNLNYTGIWIFVKQTIKTWINPAICPTKLHMLHVDQRIFKANDDSDFFPHHP